MTRPLSTISRILDANANRAREAMRVMEDAARFGLDHAGLAGALKQLRHDFAAAIGSLPGVESTIVHRDTPGDVGTGISTEAEGARDDLRSVAIAAGKRLSEALRAIEESAKCIEGGGACAQAIEQLRYRGYELEKQLALAFGSPHKDQWRVCVLVTESLCAHHAWQRVCERALEAGADAIQLREKSLSDRELIDRARWLRALTREHNASLVINDRPDIAQLTGADMVHLGQADMPIAEARKIVGLSVGVGVSCTTAEQAREAALAGADCLGLGPMFVTSTKDAPGGRADGSVAGPGLIRGVLADPAAQNTPQLAIGGIGTANIEEVVAAGARGVAVSSAVCGAEDPGGVVRQLQDSIERVAPAV